MKRWRSFFVAFLIWTAYGLFSAWIERNLTLFSAKPQTWGRALYYECSFAYIVCALSFAVVWLADRYRLERPKLLRNAAIHALGMLFFVAISRLLWELLAQVTGHAMGDFTASRIFRSLNYGLADAGPLYWLIVVVHNASDYYRRYQGGLVQAADLNVQLAHAQLQSLKMQLHPHFLFNTLHAISELIHEDPAAAERMIVGLSQLLRLSLETSSAVEVPLDQELRFTQLYLDIEKMRFDDRLQITMDIDPDVHDAMVPNLILQPLVENAIKHGISKRPGPGEVRLSAKRDLETLVITIQDNGVGIDTQNGPRHEGIGLGTTRARLQKLYGSDQSFLFVKRPGAGAEAVLRLPLKLETIGGTRDYVAGADCRR